MNDWLVWMSAAGALVILEMFTGTFYLLMIAIGLAVGGLAALGGATVAIQLLVAAAVGAIATYALHRSRFGRRPRTDALRDPNVNMDIGQTLRIDAWRSDGDGRYAARVMYRGADWDVELAAGAH